MFVHTSSGIVLHIGGHNSVHHKQIMQTDNRGRISVSQEKNWRGPAGNTHSQSLRILRMLKTRRFPDWRKLVDLDRSINNAINDRKWTIICLLVNLITMTKFMKKKAWRFFWSLWFYGWVLVHSCLALSTGKTFIAAGHVEEVDCSLFHHQEL